MNTRIHPAILEELRQEAAEAEETLGNLKPGSFDALQVIAGLKRLRQEIQEVEYLTHSLPDNYLL